MMNDIHDERCDFFRLKNFFFFFFSGNVVSAGTISSPWTPVTGPPADSNGAGPDSKNLDVGDVSDVSFLYYIEFNLSC